MEKRSDIVKHYCSHFPKMLDRTLARKLYEENKGLFKSIETARDGVRYYRKHHGIKNAKSADAHGLGKPKTHDFAALTNEQDVCAKILILDIETAPLLAHIWGIWNQNINLDNIHSDWFILTWAAKWLFDKKVYSARVTPKEAKKQDDKRIVKSLLTVLSEADIVVTHNGNRFDLPRINTRALVHNLRPPLPYHSIDTLKVAKRQFNFTSNKLDYINKMLKLPLKEETNMKLWRNCVLGLEESLKKMERYNINDVRIHEETYLRMRAWIKPHPNVSLHVMSEKDVLCPSCGSKKLKEVGKYYNTTVSSYEMLVCENCGASSRKRKGKSTKTILSSSPR